MRQDFGTTRDGAPVEVLTLAAGALRVQVLTLGAILRSVRLAGADHDLTVGSDRLADYEDAMRFNGCIVGPVANRLSGAQALVAGRLCRFEDTGGGMTLHSGAAGLHTKLWRVAALAPDAATLALDLPDGEGGFPGNRRLEAAFSVLAPATLRLTLRATSDADTLMNPANHSYWNLDGGPTWAGHALRVVADRALRHHPDGRVAGGPVPVAGTALDLRDGPVLQPGAPALDTNFCLADSPRPLTEAAELRGRSGIRMRLLTTAPGLQIFDGRPDYRGLALEPQSWPDAPANPGFPPILLAAGQRWEQVSEWRFARG